MKLSGFWREYEMSDLGTSNFHFIYGFEILLSWEESMLIFLSVQLTLGELFMLILFICWIILSFANFVLSRSEREEQGSEREAADACRSLQAGRAAAAHRSGRGKCCSKIPAPARRAVLVTASHVFAPEINDRMEHVVYKLSVEDKEALANARKSKWDNNEDMPGN